MKKSLAVLLFIFIAIALGTAMKDYLAKARMLELKTNLSSLIVAQRAYHKEYQKYSEDFKAICFNPEGNLHAQFFLRRSEIPVEIASRLSAEDLPFADEDGLQIFIMFQDGLHATYSKVRIDSQIIPVQLLSGEQSKKILIAKKLHCDIPSEIVKSCRDSRGRVADSRLDFNQVRELIL